MPDWVAVVALGVIEGLTEFLPVSSTGHLLLAENSHLLPQQSELFNIVIQAGAVLAVFFAFSRRIKALALTLNERGTRDYLLKLILAFALTGVGGLLAKKAGFSLPKEIGPIAWATLIGGVLILMIEWWARQRRLHAKITWAIAAAVGLAQLLAAVFPGTSRAGSTILIALALGVNRPAATEFSFLLGIPTLFTASGYEIYKALEHPGLDAPTDWGMVALGTLVSAIVAFLVVKWLVGWVQTHTFVAFGWYRIALGLLMVALAVGPR
jgi:undecaprenyl-diphosphatase